MPSQNDIDLQWVVDDAPAVTTAQLADWVAAALAVAATFDEARTSGAVTVRVVDEDESGQLNEGFREKPGPTNVLAFPADSLLLGVGEDVEPELGDLVVCLPVVQREAGEQNKAFEAHFTHMVVHGTLHLAGFDHIEDEDALVMEALEVQALQDLGIANPY